MGVSPVLNETFPSFVMLTPLCNRIRKRYDKYYNICYKCSNATVTKVGNGKCGRLGSSL